MARRKAAALDVPADDQAAIALVADYVAAERRVLELKLGYELQIDKLKAERDAVVANCNTAQAGRFAALKAWWEAGGKDRAGKKRSAELAGATLGIRLTPPAVKFAKGVKAEAIIAWLGKIRWQHASRFLRTKVELDKQAIVKADTETDVRTVFLKQGVTVVQTDEFFIDCGLDEAAIRARLGATPKE